MQIRFIFYLFLILYAVAVEVFEMVVYNQPMEGLEYVFILFAVIAIMSAYYLQMKRRTRNEEAWEEDPFS